MQLNRDFLAQSVAGISFLHDTAFLLNSFSLDTRTLQPGDIFVALEGAQSDGHNFLKEAFAKGAAGCMVNSAKKGCIDALDARTLHGKAVIFVPNTLQALLDVAAAWRAQFTYPVIAITGSVGKTTTKEMLSSILDLAGKQYKASAGNQNTLIGVALTILGMRPEHEAAIFELGISRRGEMKKLVALAQPTMALITGIGHSHMEGLGSIVDIAAEKRDVFSSFKDNNIGIINGDQPLLASIAYKHPVVRFGSKTTNQVQARKIHITSSHSSFVLKLYKEKFNIVFKGTHKGRIFNALGASCAAYLLNIPSRYIVQAIQTPVIVAGRYEERALAGGKGIIINDCYNASPESMKASLLAFEHVDIQAQKICVLGDMLELGVNSPFWHRQLGRILSKVPSVRNVILVGAQVAWTKKTLPLGVTVEHVQDWQAAVSILEKKLDKKSVVLVKGSRGMQLDRLVESLTERQV